MDHPIGAHSLQMIHEFLGISIALLEEEVLSQQHIQDNPQYNILATTAMLNLAQLGKAISENLLIIGITPGTEVSGFKHKDVGEANKQ